MLKEILHVGLTVSDLDRSIDFYKNILGLEFQGEIVMEGPATDRLFQKTNCQARIAYLEGSQLISAPPVELIQFLQPKAEPDLGSLFKTSISELCFRVDNIEAFYEKLVTAKVYCLSGPEEFDFTAYGFGKSKAFYFKDPDGIILEAMECLD